MRAETFDESVRPLTPREIVRELDKYIIGQQDAKRAVAIALRNRWRRQRLPEALQEEIAPKNIIMIGPTGVGKTEIARRLAKLAQAPFLKVEATKFTEVGYVGRDVDSMIRDLVESAVQQVRAEDQERVRGKAREHAEERLLNLLVPPPPKTPQRHSWSPAPGPATGQESSASGPFGVNLGNIFFGDEQPTPTPTPATSMPVESEPGFTPATPAAPTAPAEDQEASHQRTREKFRKLLAQGKLDGREVELEVTERNTPMVEIFSPSGMEEMGINVNNMFGNLFGGQKKKRRMKIGDALELLTQEEAQKLVDMDAVTKRALKLVEQSGIVFIDEIDKVAGRESGHGPDVSREGVQRDLLPIVEGSTITTKYGPVRTNHILFIASGAFHVSKPTDLIPELQGRFPIRVELKSLTRDDFVRILTEPENCLIKQYREMIQTEGVELNFTADAIARIAQIASDMNDRMQNIGARRLYTILEKLLEEVSFEAPDMGQGQVPVTPEYIQQRLTRVIEDEDLRKYIL